MVSAKASLQKLLEGNERFVNGQALHPHQGNADRESGMSGQHPVAIVLSCSDSRVPPEIIFDQGIGDLFVIRVAGNLVDNLILGSIEYAADHLRVPLLIVLGHTDCSAVTAAIKSASAESKMDYILKAIQPAVEEARNIPGDQVTNTVEIHVRQLVESLEAQAPILNYLVDHQQLIVEGAVYDIKTGCVTLLE